MGIKVVHGYLGRASSSESSTSNTTKTAPTQTSPSDIQGAVRVIQHAATQTARSSEAVIASVRVTRSENIPEKIRDPEKARDLAEDVARRISEDERAPDAHANLSSVSARSHFVS